MAEITKKDIKEIFTKSLEPFANAIQKDIQKLDKKIDSVRTELKDDIGAVKTELKEEIGSVRTELKGEIWSVRTELREVKSDVREMKENSSVLFDKLDRYIELYERIYHDFLAMNAHVARLEKRIIKLEEKLAI